jgi:AcrR family transcriptional regulator
MPATKKRETRAKRRPLGVQIGDDEARAAILVGAAKVFADRGTRTTSVDQILEMANVSRRTFYRHYKSKDEVALTLYKIGTKALFLECKRAVEEEPTVLKQFERCIDAHLRNARQQSRLVYVLGGEAQQQESPLHARRMEMHDRLVALHKGALDTELRINIDPMFVRTILLALEAIPRILLHESDEGRSVSDEGIARARRVMMRVLTASLEARGASVTPLPLDE